MLPTTEPGSNFKRFVQAEVEGAYEKRPKRSTWYFHSILYVNIPFCEYEAVCVFASLEALLRTAAVAQCGT
uniref:Uncharacterized protein n=1 Tax=Ascaris lumbricoides TaxID=6252 RepID=A0A0M3I8Q0_ASCLU